MKKVEKRHETDVLILPDGQGGEHFVCEGVTDRWSLAEATRAYLNQHFSATTLCVVAITDGAKGHALKMV